MNHLRSDPASLAAFQAHESITAIVFNVRDRFDFARPVTCANSSSEPGACSAMIRSRSRLPAESTLAKDSVEVNQTFGSSAATRRCPRATAIVRAFISS
jgi:hypothetical protein